MSLEFESAAYSYGGGKFSLAGVSFRIGPGTCAALTGKNGSGKTTLGKLAAGILKPDSGRVLISGEDIARLTLGQIGARAGYLFQNPERQIFAPTVLEDLTFPAVICGENEEKAQEQAREMLAGMGLSGLENRSVFRLSGGEKQRLALAGLLIRKPRLLILDEPTTGIDAENRERLGGILRGLLEGGTSVLLITHDINFADAYCDSRLTLDEGKLC
jgi:energy-coupling factor transport system ATP-binding protein